MVTNTHLLNGYMIALQLIFWHGCVFVCPSLVVCVLVFVCLGGMGRSVIFGCGIQ